MEARADTFYCAESILDLVKSRPTRTRHAFRAVADMQRQNEAAASVVLLIRLGQEVGGGVGLPPDPGRWGSCLARVPPLQS